MKFSTKSVLFALSAALLSGPTIADDADEPRERERQQVTAEERQQAMQERREAVRKLPPEQRAAVRDAHRKSMTPEERAAHREQMQNHHRRERPEGARHHKRRNEGRSGG